MYSTAKMKRFAFIALMVAAACGGEKKTDAAADETSLDSVKVNYDGLTAVGVTHEVKNYDDWLRVYTDRSDPESRLSIFASPDDPNLVTVFQLTHGHKDARNAFQSPQFKQDLNDAGVISEPVLHFYDVKFRVIEKTEKKYRLGVSHEIEEYNQWKKVFDEDEPIRLKANLELRAISLDADNPHMVNIMFATDDIDKAKEVINSEELKKRMKEAGVRSEPVFSVFQVPEKF